MGTNIAKNNKDLLLLTLQAVVLLQGQVVAQSGKEADKVNINHRIDTEDNKNMREITDKKEDPINTKEGITKDTIMMHLLLSKLDCLM